MNIFPITKPVWFKTDTQVHQMSQVRIYCNLLIRIPPQIIYIKLITVQSPVKHLANKFADIIDLH